MFNLFKKTSSSQKGKSKETEAENKNDVNAEINPTEFEKSVTEADNGSISSATYVGMSYSYGIEKGNKQHPYGVAPNSELAIKYLTMAAEKGFLKAQAELGMLYHRLNNYSEEGFKWINLAAKRGDADSQLILATYYKKGEVVDKDENMFYQWCLESACNGNIYAKHYLGEFYNEHSVMLLENEEYKNVAWIYAQLGHKWCKSAATSGVVKSIYYTGVSYFFGLGTQVDMEKARAYIDLAIESGDSSAIKFKKENMS